MRSEKTRSGKESSGKLDRRHFLKGAGLAVGAAGASATVAAGNAVAAPAETETQASGYRETESVRTYYRLARF